MNLNSGGEDNIETASLPVTLQAGYNVVSMGNCFGWSPDIDCFEVVRKGK